MPNEAKFPVRVRIAPSPTGDPHVGTAYIGLVNYVFARQRGGAFVVRIEDTDRARSTKSSEEAILRSLKWFGLRWDEGPDCGGPYGPYRQSERAAIYQRHARELIEGGHAYRCFCTPERLAELRKRQREAKTSFGYDGHCRHLDPEDAARRAEAGEAFVVRLRMPSRGEAVIRDRLRGEVSFQQSTIDDQVLLKSDGLPTYHLANVVDDHLMGITHVIRAEEWLISTPKHVRLYEAFGWTPPEFIHLPLLRNPDRSKISKRKNPVSLVYYEEAGFLPEALRNYLALMGWTPEDEREIFSLEEQIELFDIDRVSLGGPVFDLEKLRWMNGQYLRGMDVSAFEERLADYLFDRTYFRSIVPLVRERIETMEEFWDKASFFYLTPPRWEPSEIIPKGKTAAQTRKMLRATMEKLDADTRRAWDAAAIEKSLREMVDASDWKVRELFMAVRVTVSGRKATPPLFEMLAVLGRDRVRWRFRQVDALLKTVK